MKARIKIIINFLIFATLFFGLFIFESDLNVILLRALLGIEVALLLIVVLKVRKYTKSIIKLNALPLLMLVSVFLIHHYNARVFESSIEDYISDKNATTFKVADITKFKWDKMYTFLPYTADEDINEAIGQKWAGSYLRGAPLTEGQTLVLFKYNGKVNHSFYIGGYIEECSEGCTNFVELTL